LCIYELSSERHADVTILAIAGELDLSVADEIESLVNKTILAGRAIVDLTHCTYIDSTVLSVFVRLTARHDEHFAMVVPLGSKSRRIFEVTQLVGTLPVYADRVAAVRRPALLNEMNLAGAQVVARSYHANESALHGGAHDIRTA
jgi:anti-anti-sigma factor